MLLRRIVRPGVPISSSSTTPVTVSLPLPKAFGSTDTSISISVPMFGPYTARPFANPTCGLAGIFLSGCGLYWPKFTTHSTSAAAIFFLPSFSATPATICTMLTASRPLFAYRFITSTAASSIVRSTLRTALPAISATSSASNGRKKISTHRERMAGGMSWGMRVVAPMRRKSAGRPFWKISWICDGMLVSSVL